MGSLTDRAASDFEAGLALEEPGFLAGVADFFAGDIFLAFVLFTTYLTGLAWGGVA